MHKLLKFKTALIIAALALVGGIAYAATNPTIIGDVTYFQAETRLNGGTKMGTPLTYSFNTGAITAGATQTQGGATLLSQEFNNVSVVGTAGDGVRLPVAYKGAHYVVQNTDAADAVSVYPATSGTIDALSANLSISVPAGQSMEFWGLSTTAWQSSGKLCVASGAGSFTTLAASGLLSFTSVAAGVTADVGSAQGNGVITTFATQVTTAAVSGDALTLPVPAAGKTAFVCNAAASNPIDVFPSSGTQVNKETANTAISLAAGECMNCVGFSATRWGCVIGSAN